MVFFFQAEDGIRDLVRSRGLGDVYKRQRDQQDRSACAERGVLTSFDDCLGHPVLVVVRRCRFQRLWQEYVGCAGNASGRGCRRARSGQATCGGRWREADRFHRCLLYTSDAADERSSVDLGGRRIIKKQKHKATIACASNVI